MWFHFQIDMEMVFPAWGTIQGLKICFYALNMKLEKWLDADPLLWLAYCTGLIDLFSRVCVDFSSLTLYQSNLHFNSSALPAQQLDTSMQYQFTSRMLSICFTENWIVTDICCTTDYSVNHHDLFSITTKHQW